MSAKEKELEKLRGDHAKIRAEIEEMMTGLNHEQVILIQSVTTWWYRNQYWKKFDIKKSVLKIFDDGRAGTMNRTIDDDVRHQ